MTDLTIEEQKDKFELETCTYMQRRSEALEKGIIVDESIFENFEDASAYMRKSKYVLLHNKAWSHIIGSNEWAQTLDPITRYDLALNVSLGSMLGCEIHTDAFLPPHLKDKNPETMGKVIFVPRDTE